MDNRTDTVYSQISNIDEHLKAAVSNAREVLEYIKARKVTDEEVREYLIKKIKL